MGSRWRRLFRIGVGPSPFEPASLAMISKKIAFPLLCGLAFLAVACSSNATGAGGPPLLAQHNAVHRGSAHSPRQKITHVVVIIQENRSFENLFAGYPGA